MRITGLLIGCAAMLFTAGCSEKTPTASSSEDPGNLSPVSKLTISQTKAGGYRRHRSSEALPPNPKPEISQTELPEQLVSFEWNLESHAPIGEELHPHPQGEVSLRIAPNGRLEGNGGCNAYFARAIPGEANLLGIGDLGFTEMACLDPEGVMDRETSYFSLLSTVSSYAVEGDRLTLFYDDDRGVLNFIAGDEALDWPNDEEPGMPLPNPNEPAEFPNPDVPPEFPIPEEPRPDFPDSLVTFDWRLETVSTAGQSVPVLPGTEITLDFAIGGELRGSAGCNSYFAGYELGEDAHILIQRIGTTRMACGDPDGVMDQESQYLIALSQATFFAIDKERLTLFDRERNATLHFTAVE
ncbi:MAG: META domain-containing protein [Gemmatimonadetes bacterium]|jgi:heat shock protein HslJ|nr:META domain-containing protein [Gemmatimonadota bacterium]